MTVSAQVYSINGDQSNTTGAINPGDTVEIALNFSGTDFYSGYTGEPTLLLSNGATATFAYAITVNGVTKPVFVYHPVAGQATADLQVAGFAPYGSVLDSVSGAAAAPLATVSGDLALNLAAGTPTTPTPPPAALAANQTFTGTTGDDMFVIGAGGDTIDGGAGLNTVVLSGDEADYTVAATASGYTVTDNRPGSPNGTNTLSNIELLKFADTTDILGTPKPVVEWSLAGAGLTSSLLASGATSVSFSSFASFDYLSLIRQAFATWASVSNLNFVQVADPGGNGTVSGPITRIFAGDLKGGGGGEVGLAYVHGPELAISSQFHFSTADFLQTVEHEIGHTLGLVHPQEGTTAIMEAVFNANDPVTTPQPYDIASIDALYGAYTAQASELVMPEGQTTLTVENAPSFLTVVGNSADNVITGGAGTEVIDGGAGNNTLIAGTGDDTLNGSAVGQTLTLEPANNPTEGIFSNGSPTITTNFSNDEIGGATNTLIKLDLSAYDFAAGTHVTSASLNLNYIASVGGTGSTTTIGVYEVTSNWTVSGGASGLTYTQIGTVVEDGSSSTLSIDITKAAQDWVNDPSANYGILLKPLNSTDPTAYFASSSYGSGLNGPQLVINTDKSIAATGDDTLVGGPGDDILNGSPGNDTFIAGTGHARMTGDGGANLFEGTAADLNGDVITDLTNQDTIRITDADPAHFTYHVAGGVLSFQENGGPTETITLGGIDAATFSVNPAASGTGADLVLASETLCFLAGTRILTPHGEIAVERLRRGDLVATHDGRAVAVTWLDRQTVSRRFANPLRAFPIRIAAGALGDNVPCRDLLVSPDHALFLDGVLIHAGALVNGTSITRETDMPEIFVYHHVETEDHSLILAENVAAETFVDNVDRMNFDNWAEHIALYPDGRPIAELPYPRAKARRQVPLHIRAALDRRAAFNKKCSRPVAHASS